MSKGKILIVEDERIVAEDIRMCLEDAGYEVCGIAKRGLDAIELAHEHKPDLALLDIVLRGDMDGIGVAHAIKEIRIPFLFLTAYSQQGIIEQAKGAEPLGYLIKPFDPSTLLSSVDVAIHKATLDQRMLESHEWFHTTLSSIGDGVIATDPSGRVVFMNPIAESLTGYQAEEAEGRAIEDIFHIQHEETGCAVPNPATEALKHNKVVNLAKGTVILPRGEGRTPIPIDDSGSPIKNAHGEIMGAVLVFRDIAEQRGAQQEIVRHQQHLESQIESRTTELRERIELEKLVNAISMDLLDFDDDHIDEGITHSLERIGSFLGADHCGVYLRSGPSLSVLLEQPSHTWGEGPRFPVPSPEEQANSWYRSELGEHGSIIIRDLEDLPNTAEAERNALAKEGVAALAAMPLGSGENCRGALVLLCQSPRAWRSHEHRFLEMFAQMVRSALERKRAAVEKERLVAELNQANKLEAIGKLTGGIAHDFNNMLLPIIGYSDMLLDPQRGRDAGEDQLLEIRKAAQSAASLTKQLLAFSRNQILEKEPLDLHDLVQNNQKMLSRVLGEDIKLQIDLAEGVGTVEADRGQMDQVLMNLCLNARDAMPNGGQIAINTKLVNESAPGTKKEAPYLRITIKDSGMGMDPEVAEKAFDPFFSTKGMNGTGLGLSVVVGIIEQHGGWINLTSELGQGTSFEIHLPHIATQVQALDSPQQSLPATAPTCSGHILLIEDEPAVIAFVQAALEKRGYKVSTAMSTKEAYRVFEADNGEFDLIFSDAMLPDGTGMEVLETILAKNPNIPALLSSGYTDHRAMIDAARANDVTFLHKPYALSSLYETVESVLNEAQLTMAS